MSDTCCNPTGTLAGRRALITGASGGIGEGIADAFAAAGATVIVHGRDHDRTHAVAERIGGIPVVADLADPTAPERIAAVACRDGLDILVNNAAYEIGRRVEALDADTYRGMLEVDLVVPVQLMRLCFPALKASGRGSVINVTSVHQSVPVSGNGGYASAKAALDMITRTASVEWGKQGVRVNNLAPGTVRTAMNTHLIDKIGEELFNEWTPLGRVATPSEMAGAALFLAGDDSGYVTGSTITVDGGYSNHLVRYPDGIQP